MSQPTLKRPTVNQPTRVFRNSLETAAHMETRAGSELREKKLHKFDSELCAIRTRMAHGAIDNAFGSDKYNIATVQYQSELNNLMTKYGFDQH
jgi:hypothetical protein